jgi:arylformamidase
MAITAPRNPYAACPVADGALLTALYDNNCNPRNQQDLRQLQAASAAAYERRAVQTQRFGPQPWQSFDVFRPPGRPCGALLFVHGGRWQVNTSREAAFWAEAACDAGLLFIGLNFPPLREGGLLGQIDAVAQALAAALAFAGECAIEPARVCVAGHSSGAHLALAALLPREDAPAPDFSARIGALLLLGGIYDLEPLSLSAHQESLGFSAREVVQGSPLHRLTEYAATARRCWLPPTLVAVGEAETLEFKRQARALHWILQWHGPVFWYVVPGAAHFAAALEFNAPHSLLRQFAVHHGL